MVNSTKSGFKHYGWIGFLCGALALGISVVHFYTGPLVKEPTLTEATAEKIMSFKQKALSVFKKRPKQTTTNKKDKNSHWNLDQKLDLSAVILGVFALIFATVGFIRHENVRAIGMGGAFGLGAILFQLINWAVAFVAVIILIGFTFFKLVNKN